MKLLLLITAQAEQGMEVAEAWQKIGAPGVTIVRTHGLHSLQESVKSGSVELPRMLVSMAAAMAHVITTLEAPGQMLISVVPADMVDKLETVASDVLGDLTEPYNGIMIVVDVEKAIGVHHYTKQTQKF